MNVQYVDLEYSKCLKTERPSLTHAKVRDELEKKMQISALMFLPFVEPSSENLTRLNGLERDSSNLQEKATSRIGVWHIRTRFNVNVIK